MSISLRESQILAGIVATGLVVAGVGYAMLRKKPSEEQLEMLRRNLLVREGRIVDGTVLDIHELPSPVPGALLQYVIYKYEIAGVVYECSQDVTPLAEVIDIHKLRLGFPCSVRYQPNNPQNSILVAENWSGIRDHLSAPAIYMATHTRRTAGSRNS
jgi:hypothetical protein